MNVAQTIVNRLRYDLDRAHEACILREGEWAATQACHYHWEQHHPDGDVDGQGSPNNPFDRDRAETLREQAKQACRELSVAHDYAVDQFINPRRFTVEVIGSDIYEVPAATRVDAQLIAFILDQGTQYQGGIINDGDVKLAQVRTRVVDNA